MTSLLELTRAYGKRIMHTLSTVVRRAAGAARFASASSAMPSLGRADGQRAADGSSYENYNEAATVYDSIRYAGGAEIIIGAFASGKSGVPLHKQSILDIGCGTGNYAAALQPHVARVTCLDGNPGMLAKCREKLGGEKLGSDVEFHQGLLPALPFEASSFDSAMCNVVIHHIEDDATRSSWERTAALLHEAKRVLKPGAALSINHVAPEQVDAYWFLDYVPECRERWRSTLVPIDALAQLMLDAGFDDVQRSTPMDYALFRPLSTYLNPSGPLDAAWRKSTSMWAVGEADELEVALRRITDDCASGAIHDVIARCERRRAEIGHTCFLYAQA